MIPLEIPDNVQDQRIDLLDRQEFVDQIHNIALTLARNKKSKCYAINGSWGSGKSFVLDMFEEQAQKNGQEGTVLDQYVIFRYNCWEYDYYEEPLIAIVASVLEQYEDKVLFLKPDAKAAVKETLLKACNQLLSIIRAGIKGATSYDIKPLIDAATDIAEGTKAQTEKLHTYDTLFAFKVVLRELRQTLASLSEYQAIVIIVDELDRCLPEYTIKVLERLHHLFVDIPNVQVILSIDRSQLEHVVRQIYGPKTNVKKYLDKFIDFELALGTGSINDRIDEVFSSYIGRFQYTNKATSAADVNDFKSTFFSKIDVRIVLAILEKCELLHDIINAPDIIHDYAIMCIEMLLTLLKYYEIDTDRAKSRFNMRTLFDSDTIFPFSDALERIIGLEYLRSKINGHTTFHKSHYFKESQREYVVVCDLWGVLLVAYRTVLGFSSDTYLDNTYELGDVKKYVIDFWYLLNTIS